MFNLTNYKRACKVSLFLIDKNINNIKYLNNFIPSVIKSFRHYGIDIDESSIEAFKDAFITYFENKYA